MAGLEGVEVWKKDKQERTAQIEILHSRVRVREGSEYNNMAGDKDGSSREEIR